MISMEKLEVLENARWIKLENESYYEQETEEIKNEYLKEVSEILESEKLVNDLINKFKHIDLEEVSK